MAMTAQEVFTKVATHLMTQKQRAVITYNGSAKSPCRYRTDTGLTCAVGCLVPDEIYDDAMEGTILPGVIERAEGGALPPALAKFVLDEMAPHRVMLRELQLIHDSWDPETEWLERLAGEAKRLGFAMPTLP